MGLQAQLLKYDAAGRIRALYEPAVSPEALADGSTPTYQGLLCLGGNPPDVLMGGLGYTYGTQPPAARPLLSIANGASVDHFSQCAMPMTANGSVAVVDQGIVHHWTAGIPYDASGRVVVAVESLPVVPSGFDSGFSNGFGI